MTRPVYRIEDTLLGYFQNLVRGGWLPDRAALQLTADLRRGRIGVSPDLLWPFQLVPLPGDGLKVVLANGRESAAREFVVSVTKGRGITIVHSPEPLPDLIEVLAPPPIEAPASRRALARKQLVADLTQDQATRKTKSVPEYKAKLKALGFTVRETDDIWREVRTAPGVGEIKKGPRGRKK